MPARAAAPAPPAPFAGIPADGFAYLRELAANQDKAWYEANKPRLERSLRAPVAALVEALAKAFAARDLKLSGDAKRSVFRMNRDVRFSKDKSPYKTHAGAVLFRPGGGKDSPGVLYVHVQPAESFVAAAFYHPEPDVLAALRDAVRRRTAEFLDVADALAAQGLPIEGEALTRLPRGFDDLADSPAAPFLKLKSLVVRRRLTQAELGSAAAVEIVAGFAEAALPLLRFGWAAVDAARGMDQAGRLAKFLPGAR